MLRSSLFARDGRLEAYSSLRLAEGDHTLSLFQGTWKIVQLSVSCCAIIQDAERWIDIFVNDLLSVSDLQYHLYGWNALLS